MNQKKKIIMNAMNSFGVGVETLQNAWHFWVDLTVGCEL